MHTHTGQWSGCGTVTHTQSNSITVSGEDSSDLTTAYVYSSNLCNITSDHAAEGEARVHPVCFPSTDDYCANYRGGGHYRMEPG